MKYNLKFKSKFALTKTAFKKPVHSTYLEVVG